MFRCLNAYSLAHHDAKAVFFVEETSTLCIVAECEMRAFSVITRVCLSRPKY
jgi:hypothetical protein